MKEANKGSHGFRRLFISDARSGGARKDVLERITHNASGEIIDIYTTWEWSTLCGAVGCLQPAGGPDGLDQAVPKDSFGTTFGTNQSQDSFSPAKDWVKVVEAVGIEPTSGNGPERRLRA